MSSVLGCALEGASLCAMLSVKSPFFRIYKKSEYDARSAYRRKYLRPGGTKSDHCFLASLILLDERRVLTRDYCTDVLKLNYDALHDAKKLRAQYLQSLSFLGFPVNATRPRVFVGHGGSDGITTDSTVVARTGGTSASTSTLSSRAVAEIRQAPQWFLLRAAVSASFFLVKAMKPPPTYKRFANGSSIQLSPDPLLTKYYQLERDPFLWNVNLDARTGEYVEQRNPMRYHTNPNSLFHAEGPTSCYLCHTNLFCQNNQLTLDTMSEAAPLAVLLLGTFSKEPFFREDGLIFVDDGKLVFSTTGSLDFLRPPSQAAKSAAGGAGPAGSSNNTSKENTLISHLVERLRYEMRENILKRKIEDPTYDLESNPIVKAVKMLIATDGMGY
ncbi:unnamed protein product [Amoebophrya sp. A25]|nr:unnamed protein product [Amoebophrya sp. A25]|eukprot:GSA25T00010970001.1